MDGGTTAAGRTTMKNDATGATAGSSPLRRTQAAMVPQQLVQQKEGRLHHASGTMKK
jgi:hypothetical protein